IGDKRRAVHHLTDWGRTHMLVGKNEIGGKVLRRAKELLNEFKGKVREAAVAILSLAEILRRQGETEAAIKILRDFIEANPDHNYIFKNLTYLAFAYFDNGQMGESKLTAEKLLRISKEKPNPEYEAVAQTILARLRIKNEDWVGSLEASEV